MQRAAVCYYGGHVAIIASNSGEWGEDPEEIILRNAEVVVILKQKKAFKEPLKTP